MNIQTENQMENAQLLSVNYNNQGNSNRVEINYQISQENMQQQGYQQLQENIQNQQMVQQNIQIQQQQIPIQLQQVETQLLTSQQAIQILSRNPIPDQFVFQHNFSNSSPCLKSCGGRNQETSTFILPSLGELVWDVDFTMPCRCNEPSDPNQLMQMMSRFIPQQALTLNYTLKKCCCCCVYPCNNVHFFSQLSYSFTNDQVRIEFRDNVGKLYILGVLIFELIECYSNLSDVLQSSHLSTMPQMIIYEPQTSNPDRLRIKAEKNNCPEDPYSILGYESLCGCCKIERKFEIYGLKQGQCLIQNRRQKCDACLSHCGYREVCVFDSCNFVDYPIFEVTFNNVEYVDRLKILFCLVHHSMYNKWYHTDYKGLNLTREMFRIQQKAQQQASQSSCQLI